MSEEIESGKRRPVLVRRRTTAALKMPVISDESRAQYEYERLQAIRDEPQAA
jgi:hypothetical protein